MARVTGSKCRLCRREGTKLFLKGERCFSPRCPVERKNAAPPGVHGQKGRRWPSEYGRQLREKQKLKRYYQILETQFRNYYKKAVQSKRGTGSILIQQLERRLDNVVYRLGLTISRTHARQLVNHGHVLVDNKKVSIPSYQLKIDQVISVSSAALDFVLVKKALENKDYKPPAWLLRKAAVGKVARLPEKEDLDFAIDEQLIVEFYSR